MGNDRTAGDKFLAGQQPIEDRLGAREGGKKGMSGKGGGGAGGERRRGKDGKGEGVDAIGIVVLNPSNGPKCNLCLEGLCHRADPVERAKK